MRQLLHSLLFPLRAGGEYSSGQIVLCPSRVIASLSSIGVILVLLTLGLAAQSNKGVAKDDYNAGERLLQSGKPLEALVWFRNAAQIERGNSKYRKRCTEVAKIASITAEAHGHEHLKDDPHQAREWFERALEYDKSNSAAAEELNVLRKAISNAAEEISTALGLIDRGELASAQSYLESASLYALELGSYDLTLQRLRGAKAALAAQQLWQKGKADGALQKLLVAEKLASECSFVQTISKTVRSGVSEALSAKAEALKGDTPSQYIEQLDLLKKAIEIDHSNGKATDATANTLRALRAFVDRASKTTYTTNEASAARVALGRYRAVERLVSAGNVITQDVTNARSHAYPAVWIRIVVGEMHGCESVLDQGNVVEVIRTAVEPVAKVNSQEPQLTLQLSDIACSATEIPRQLVQQVNSTYVAAQNQMANPDYTTLQTSLASAEQALNRAYIEYSTNPNFASGFAYGRAQRQVRQLQAELSSTSPYINQDIVQQYQYDKFAATRSYQINARLTFYSKEEQGFASRADVSGSSEESKDGVSGVLPQDRSGASNLNPSLLPIADHKQKAWDNLKKQIDLKARALVAQYLATLAHDQRSATGDRLAALLYLSQISAGTEYDGQLKEELLQTALFADPPAAKSLLDGLSLSIPERMMTAQFQSPVPHHIDLQAAITGVVALETDTGTTGSGFFVTSGCAIVTNLHVIENAETIVVRDSARKIYVGKVIAQDTDRDLAFLTTNARSCTPLPMNASKGAVIGAEVYAIGNPLGLAGTVTKGIVSALRSSSSGISYVQIDATLNPGNSGGPLLDSYGDVLGVTTFKAMGFEGLNFAVASTEIVHTFGRFLR